ncbi:MAG: ETC complex I subunit [Alphaproteobacteria bacterium 32-64-14]|nr:MAG: ETC complex I subunit [Alphaproteobacteria bacterium 32-64-14]
MLAKIYRPARNAMQSGTAKSQDWLLEFDSASARTVDPLMGWIGNADTNTQVRMTFETREEAIDYARRQGIPFQVTEPREAKRVIKSYAENFAAVRKRPWTH